MMGSKEESPPSSILVQKNIKENATEVQNFLADLNQWSKEMRAKELAESNKPIPQPEENPAPLRNERNKVNKAELNHKAPSVPVPSTDYKAWDKFDADKVCEEMDEKEDLEGKQVESEEAQIRRRAIELRLKNLANEKKELGNQALKDKDYTKAVEYYSEGISCDKKNAVLYANRAQVYLYLKQYDRAAQDCSESIKNDPGFVKAYFRRAKAQFSMGKLVDAKNDLNRVLQFDPANPDAKQLLTEINRKTMQSLLSVSAPSSKSAPATPSYDGPRLPHFPGILTRLTNSLTRLNPPEDDDEDDIGGGGDNEIYPKDIQAIIKPPSRRSKRPLFPLHVRVIGEEREDKEKRQRLVEMNGIGNGNISGSSNSSSLSSLCDPTSPNGSNSNGNGSGNGGERARTTSSSLPGLFSQMSCFDAGVIPPRPKTAAQFIQDWRKLKSRPEMCAEYLNKFKGEDYALFGESMEYTLLSDILDLLVWEFLPRGWPVLHHLKGLATVKRFPTLALFLTEKDRANARKLIAEVRIGFPNEAEQLLGKYALN